MHATRWCTEYNLGLEIRFDTCLGQLLVVQRVLQRPPLLVVLLVRAELLFLFLELPETLLAHKRSVCGGFEDEEWAGQGRESQRQRGVKR